MSERVAVIAGGVSMERDVSLRSGERVAAALAGRGHEVTRLDLDDGFVDAVVAGGSTVAYLTLHGKAGEDGTIQGLLELLGVPYTGPDAVASALAWDKAVCKGLLRRHGLATPDWMPLSVEAVRDMGATKAVGRVADQLGMPLVVKPAQGGASLGVRRVDRVDGVGGALVAAFSYHHTVLLERAVLGTEVAVSVVGGDALPPVEVVPREGAYDFSARYTHGATDFYAPARLPAEVLGRCRDVALAAYGAIGCRHVARVDLIVDADGVPWVLELDTCPGMTETSLLPMAGEAAGLDVADLSERVLAFAVADGPRHVHLGGPVPGAAPQDRPRQDG